MSSAPSLHQQESYLFDLIFQVYYGSDVAVGFVAVLVYSVGFWPLNSWLFLRASKLLSILAFDTLSFL